LTHQGLLYSQGDRLRNSLLHRTGSLNKNQLLTFDLSL